MKVLRERGMASTQTPERLPSVLLANTSFGKMNSCLVLSCPMCQTRELPEPSSWCQGVLPPGGWRSTSPSPLQDPPSHPSSSTTSPSPRPARHMTCVSSLPGGGPDLVIILSGAWAARESQRARAHAPLRLPCSALRLSGNHCPELWVHGAAIFLCCWRWGGHQLSLITRQTTGQLCPRLLIAKSGLPLPLFLE